MISADEARELVLKSNLRYVEQEIQQAISEGKYRTYLQNDRVNESDLDELVKLGYKVRRNEQLTYIQVDWSK